jgi:hypothetical protein
VHPNNKAAFSGGLFLQRIGNYNSLQRTILATLPGPVPSINSVPGSGTAVESCAVMADVKAVVGLAVIIAQDPWCTMHR